jgi:isovaleryl-CoA dehydrogenase
LNLLFDQLCILTSLSSYLQLRNTVRKFANAAVAPRAAEVDKTNAFPNELWQKMGECGLLGVTAPGNYF